MVHFFSHIGEDKASDADNNDNSSASKRKTENPINDGSSKALSLTKCQSLSPWKYCLTTYGENNDNSVKTFEKDNLNKKKKEKDKTFECYMCSKKFGWSTDLKRHLLIHTGIVYLKIVLFIIL